MSVSGCWWQDTYPTSWIERRGNLGAVAVAPELRFHSAGGQFRQRGMASWRLAGPSGGPDGDPVQRPPGQFVDGDTGFVARFNRLEMGDAG